MSGWRWNKKPKVEDYRSISTTFFLNHGYFTGHQQAGGMNWLRGREVTSSLDFEVNLKGWAGEIRFYSSEVGAFSYLVELTSSCCFFGGKRWWFACPAFKNNLKCNRRALKLYFGKRAFLACRECCNLTYHTAQTHDSRVNKLARDPAELFRKIQGKPVLALDLVTINAIFKLQCEKRRETRP